MAKQQTIFRVEKVRDFVTMHSGFLKRDDLSLKAKGLLAYILCLQDDCEISLVELERHHKDGRSSLRTALNELIAAGYIVHDGQDRDETTGRLGASRYVVFEVSTVSGFSAHGFPAHGFPAHGESVASNDLYKHKTYRLQTKDTTKPFGDSPKGESPPVSPEHPPKTAPRKPRTPRESTTYPQEWYRQCETVYQEAKGITLSGDEFLPVQRELKSMFRSGNTPDVICAFMRALAASREPWTEAWTIKTVRMKLPEWRAGKLKLNGTRPPGPVRSWREERLDELRKQLARLDGELAVLAVTLKRGATEEELARHTELLAQRERLIEEGKRLKEVR